MNTKTENAVDFEAWLEEEVPCGDCGDKAVVMSPGHGCAPVPPSSCKCLPCYKVWHAEVSRIILWFGFVECGLCNRRFTSIESFSPFRSF